jgi:hypothetical protein
MTGTEDSQSTRPISVAELLARNGTIGAPPAGGRRRRRRGDTDSISVAELTGEIPIITDRDIAKDTAVQDTADQAVLEEPIPEPIPEPTAEPVAEAVALTGPAAGNGAVESVTEEQGTDEAGTEGAVEDATEIGADTEDETDDDYAGAVSEYAAYIRQRESDADEDFFAPPRRSSFAPRRFTALGGDAEEMSPDPVPVEDDVDEIDEIEAIDDIDDAEAIDDVDTVGDLEDDAKDRSPSYLRGSAGALFGGPTVTDDVARRGPEDLERDDSETAEPKAMSSFMRGVWIVGQCVLAVAFGAGLFVAFDQLWKWNNIVALVLSVLVILGLVVGVRVVRKTEDIGSTLIAVAVGALVTLGPLALLQSG